MDHGVLELSTDPLHFPDIDVLDGIAIIVEANGAPRSISKLCLAQRPYQPLDTLGVSAEAFQRSLANSRLKR